MTPRAPAPLAPPKARHRRKHLTVPEWRAVLQAARETGPREHALVLLIYEAGLRREEPGQMRLSYLNELHESPARVFVWRQKGSLNGYVEVGESCAQALNVWVNTRYPSTSRRKGDNFVFPGGARRGGGPPQGITGRTVYNLFRVCAHLAGLGPDLQHPHALKHSRVQHLLEHCSEQGLDPWSVLQTLAQVIGHSTAQTTIRNYLSRTGAERQAVREFTRKVTR